MPDTTPVYGIPYAELGDSPNGPSQQEALALGVESELIRIDAAIAAINGLGYNHVSSAVNETGITSGTFAPGGTPVGTSFVAPPSGNVIIHFSGYILNSINGGSTILSGEVKTGGTVGSGTLISSAANFNRAIIVGKAVNSGAEALGQSTRTVTYVALTPGNTYNWRFMHAVAGGGTGQVLYREVLVVPML